MTEYPIQVTLSIPQMALIRVRLTSGLHTTGPCPPLLPQRLIDPGMVLQ